MTFKIDTLKKKAAVLFPDNNRLEGSFFVSPQSPNHAGSEYLSELLENDKRFLPFELLDGKVELLRKKNIVWLHLEEDDLYKNLPDAGQIAARIRFLSGDTMEGNVFSDLPESQSRLSDFINSGKEFFYMRSDNKDYFINARFITRVHPGTPE